MSIFRDMLHDWPFLLYVATFVFAFASLVFVDLILLGVSMACALIAVIIEKKGKKK